MLRRDRGSTPAHGLLWLLRHVTGIAKKRNFCYGQQNFRSRVPHRHSAKNSGCNVQLFGPHPNTLILKSFDPRAHVANSPTVDALPPIGKVT